jgi:CPA2 family monovalent cation:H+ antiporter-2
MAIVGPILAVNSERIGGIFGRRRRRIATSPNVDVEREAELALAEAAMSGDDLPEAFEIAAGELSEEEAAVTADAAVETDTEPIADVEPVDRDDTRRRDPEY